MILLSYVVKKINSTIGKEFIIEHHYSHGCHNGPMCWGLFDGEQLIGVIAFATPGSENVRASVFGKEYVDAITELHRLVILDGTPTNTESWFIARALKELKETKPQIKGVLSFADTTEGHRGTIYQATNALYVGKTAKARFYRDETGRLRYPRQNGVNISKEEALLRGWSQEMRQPKHRYLFLLGSKSEKKHSRRMLKLKPQSYPVEE